MLTSLYLKLFQSRFIASRIACFN